MEWAKVLDDGQSAGPEFTFRGAYAALLCDTFDHGEDQYIKVWMKSPSGRWVEQEDAIIGGTGQLILNVVPGQTWKLTASSDDNVVWAYNANILDTE